VFLLIEKLSKDIEKMEQKDISHHIEKYLQAIIREALSKDFNHAN
jgi:hypothetical protein